MLKRQQASAVVAARNKIVEGAVGMVESALNLLSTKGSSIWMKIKSGDGQQSDVVLCGDRDTQPVLNTGH